MSAAGGKTLVGDGVENHSADDLAPMDQCHRNGERIHAMDVIRGPVQGIDDPHRFGGQQAEIGVLFAEKGVLGALLGQKRRDRLLRGQIRLGHQVSRGFFPGCEPPSPVQQLLAAPPGGLWLNRSKALCPADQGSLSTTRSKMGKIAIKALRSLDILVLSD